MTQYLADVHQRCSLRQQVGGQRMPQPVSPTVQNSGSSSGAPCHVADQVSGNRLPRRPLGDEHHPMRCRRPPTVKVTSQGFADIDG